LNLPNRRFTSAPRSSRSPWGQSFAARSPKGSSKPASKPAAKAPAKASPKPAAKKPGAKPTLPQGYKPTPKPKDDELVGAVHVRRMSRGRKPPIIPVTPILPPPPPAPPDFKGAAPTMHYGEAPIPPEKRARSAAKRSTAAKAAEAARNAVWAVSSEKTTAQIQAAKGAFETALSEHKDSKAANEAAAAAPPAPAGDDKAESPRAKKAPIVKDRWAFFREELARESDADDPHEPWRKETATPRHEMFDAISDETMDEVEKALKVKLPPSYRDFNKFWGGGRLYTQEWRNIRLVGAHDMERELRNRLVGRMHLPFIPLADMGDGDYLAFDTSKPSAKGEYPIVWWYGGHAKKKLSPTFADWLEQLVAAGGEAFWWEED
jgi:hypothetical protein